MKPASSRVALELARTAFQDAASIASLLLTTEASVCEFPDKDEKARVGLPGGMGGGMY